MEALDTECFYLFISFSNYLEVRDALPVAPDVLCEVCLLATARTKNWARIAPFP